jgi:hypothetical protein
MNINEFFNSRRESFPSEFYIEIDKDDTKFIMKNDDLEILDDFVGSSMKKEHIKVMRDDDLVILDDFIGSSMKKEHTKLMRNNDLEILDGVIDCSIKKKHKIPVVMLCCLAMILLVVISSISLPDDTGRWRNSIKFLTPPPMKIARFCEMDFISTPYGYSLCENICEVAKCCTLNDTVEGSCVDQNVDVCSKYYRYCSPIFEKSSSEEISNIDFLNLENICSLENLKTEIGKAECYDACTPASTCFQNNADYDALTSWCKMFSPCKFMYR